MKKIFKLLIVNIIMLVMVLSINLPIFATNQLITETELDNYLKAKIGANYGIVLNGNKFEITDNENNKTYNLYYDLDNYEFYTEETFNKNDNAEVVNEKMEMLLKLPDYCFNAVADASDVDQDLYESYVKKYGLGSMYSDWRFTYTVMVANAKQNGKELYVEDLISADEVDEQADHDCFSIFIEKIEQDDTVTLKFKLKLNSNLDFSILNPNIENYDYYFILKVGETLNVPWFSGEWNDRPGYDGLDISFENNTMVISGSEILKEDISIVNMDTAEYDVENGWKYNDEYTALVRVVSDDYEGETGIIKPTDNSDEGNDDNQGNEVSDDKKEENDVKDEGDEKQDEVEQEGVKQEDGNKEASPDNTLSQNKLPATGKSFLAICSLIILTIICMIKYYKYKKID